MPVPSTPNRQSGYICNFYELGSAIEDIVRRGFTQYAKTHARRKTFYRQPIEVAQLVKKVTWAECYGAKKFRDLFGRSKTKEQAINFILQFGLASTTDEADDVLQYLTENDIPYLWTWCYIFESDWDIFTLVKENEMYRINNYPLGVAGLASAWFAASQE